jgi:hypothetical protein
MKQWEYHTTSQYSDLKALGLEGWELVSVAMHGSWHYILKRPLKVQPKMEPLPDYGDHLTMKEFLAMVENGDVDDDDDGSGNYATATEMSARTVDLNNIKKTAWTHVVWFNK